MTQKLFEWGVSFAQTAQAVFDWLFTPVEISGSQIAPAFLVVGSLAIAGLTAKIIKAIILG